MGLSGIVTIVLSVFLVMCVGISFIMGYKKGLIRTSVRAGMFVLFAIIAGIITMPISKAIMKIDISSLNWEVNGVVAKTIPEGIEQMILENAQVAEAVEAVPSTMELIDALPSVVASILVFMILIPIMTFLSWGAYRIVYDFCLPVGREERKAKKLQKQKEKNERRGVLEQIAKENSVCNNQPIKKRNKRKWLGAGVGVVYGFIFAFVALLPLTSIFSTISKITTTDASVKAESEVLTETTGDLAKYYLGEEILDALSAYGNSTVGKILTIGGLDDLIFDEIISVKVNDEKISLRKDIENIALAYNDCVYIVDEIGKSGTYKNINFNEVEKVSNRIFDIGIFRALAPEVVPYVASELFESEGFKELDYHEQIQTMLLEIIDDLETSEKGFVNTLKNDFSSILDVAKSACEVGLVDELVGGQRDKTTLINALSAEDYKLLNTITSRLTESETFKSVVSNGASAGLSILSQKAGENADFGEIEREKVDWESFKTSFNSFLRNLIEIYKVLNKYDFDEFVKNPKMISSQEFSTIDLKQIVCYLGKELELFKNSELFKNQNKNSYKEIVSYVARREDLSSYLDEQVLKNINWESETLLISEAVCAFKESGALDIFVNHKETELDDLIKMLIETDASNKTFARQILTPALNMQLSQKIVKTGLEQFNKNIEKIRKIFGEGVVEIDLTNFVCLSATDKAEIINMFESLSLGASKIGLRKFAEDTLKAVFELNDLENGVANSSYLASGLTALGKIEITKSTYNSIFVSVAEKENVKKYLTPQNVVCDDFDWSEETELLNKILTIFEREKDGLSIKEILFPNYEFENIELNKTKLSQIMDNLSSELAPNISAMKVLVETLYNAKTLKQSLVFIINSMIEQITQSISNETTTYKVDEIYLKILTENQKLQISNVLECLGKTFDVLTKENFEFEKLTEDEIVLVGTFLNKLKENAFNIVEIEGTTVRDPRCVVSSDGKTVENGGVFAELYLTMIDYAKQTYEFGSDADYGAIEWINFLKTAQKLSKLSSDIGIMDIVSDFDLKVKDVLDIVGIEEEVSTKVDNIQKSFEETNKQSSAQTYGELAESLNSITETDVNKIVEKVNELSGKDVSSAVKIEDIQKEKAVSARISSLLALGGISDVTREDALSDLCNGATVVLTKAIANGTVITNNISGGSEALASAIDSKTTDNNLRSLVKSLFGLN